MAGTIAELIYPGGDCFQRRPGTAIVLPYGVRPFAKSDSTTISYREFANLYDHLVSSITSFISHHAEAFRPNIGLPCSSVSIVLPNSLEFIASFFAVANCGIPATPLNPNYTAKEFIFYLKDVKSFGVIIPRAALLNDGINRKGIIEAAKELDLYVLEIGWSADYQRLVLDVLISPRAFSGSSLNFSNTAGIQQRNVCPNSVALILHTSGTTSKPKSVPLTHTNILASVRNIVNTYKLSPSDVSLIVMPLFHVHGLIGALFSTLYSGGSVVVPLKFSATTFLKHLLDFKCSWYSAVPTIHKILLSSPDYLNAPNGFQCLRFVRSCSASLAPATLRQLEQVFKVPVLEAYAMTEAAHQMTSNPLPPAARKPGSVGVAQGGKLCVFNGNNLPCPVNKTGEVCISGINVTNGYIANETANRDSYFLHGGCKWFKTGDQGYLDSEQYLHLVGRLKELINRGGEKISPGEIDAVLLQHPLVAEAVTFGVNDVKYGQEVNAAVVLKQSAKTALSEDEVEKELKNHCLQFVAAFKQPKKIFVTTKIPQTATGKVQRLHVSEHFQNLAKQKKSKL